MTPSGWPVVRAIALGTLLGSLIVAQTTRAADPELSFERDVRPILKQNCFHCHGEEPEKQGGLDVRTVKRMRAGGDSGAAFEPGTADASLIWKRVAADEMPDGPKKLTAAQKEILKSWIDSGARTLRAEPDDPDAVRFTEEELDHWAFRPVAKVPVPRPSDPGATVRNPIDAFLLARLQQAGLNQFSPQATRESFLRRVTFDLTGLPPTPEELQAFQTDESVDAGERLIDRLLATPQYGERWGRHWLDVAGYSETDGGTGADPERPNAWRYRDYVIDSWNADKPYSRFVEEQLAGDEIAARPLNLTDPATISLLTATGFLRMAPDVTQTANALADRNQAVADVVKVTGSAILGLTIGCAQCHDHKYDPIAAEDYYSFRALFDPAFNLQNWQQPAARQIDVTPQAVVDAADKIEAEAVKQDAELKDEMTVAAKLVQDRAVERLPEADREPARTAAETKEAERTQEQKDLLLKYPNVKPIEFVRGFFVEYDRELHAKFTKRQGEIAALRETKPPRQYVMATVEPAVAVPESRLHFRGDPEQPQKPVQPSEITALDRDHQFHPDSAAVSGSTGRRLAYARWLTRGDHPLTARVVVNRLWQHHFGRGLVATPGDFGLNGDRPSHPELLDWLAADLVSHDWSLKRTQRLILTSAAYRQSSARTDELDAIDPDNRLYGRMNLQRLEAEAVRDALLAASGLLADEIGGSSTPVTEDGEGRPVFGKRKIAEGLFAGVAGSGRDGFRRSIYLQSRRALPIIMLETFDLPAMTPNCDIRRSSTVATQSLLFLNDETIWQYSDAMAERLWAEPTPEARVHSAFLRLFGAAPKPEELAACLDFLNGETADFAAFANAEWQERIKQQPDVPQKRALAALCQTLMCSNRFLYLD